MSSPPLVSSLPQSCSNILAVSGKWEIRILCFLSVKHWLSGCRPNLGGNLPELCLAVLHRKRHKLRWQTDIGSIFSSATHQPYDFEQVINLSEPQFPPGVTGKNSMRWCEKVPQHSEGWDGAHLLPISLQCLVQSMPSVNSCYNWMNE